MSGYENYIFTAWSIRGREYWVERFTPNRHYVMPLLGVSPDATKLQALEAMHESCPWEVTDILDNPLDIQRARVFVALLPMEKIPSGFPWADFTDHIFTKKDYKLISRETCVALPELKIYG